MLDLFQSILFVFTKCSHSYKTDPLSTRSFDFYASALKIDTNAISLNFPDVLEISISIRNP